MYRYAHLNFGEKGGTPILVRKLETLGEITPQEVSAILKQKWPDHQIHHADYSIDPIDSEEVPHFPNHEMITIAGRNLVPVPEPV